MPDDGTTATEQPVAQTQPAPEAKPADGAFDPAAWLGGLSAEQKAVIDEYATHRVKPVESELHGLRSEVGRLKKAADPDTQARLRDTDSILTAMKAATISLYGQDVADDIKDIEDFSALATALKFLSKSGKTAAAAPKQEGVPAPENGVDAFLKARQGAPSEAGRQWATVAGNGARGAAREMTQAEAYAAYDKARAGNDSAGITAALAALERARANRR